jgi:hypothetical protein
MATSTLERPHLAERTSAPPPHPTAEDAAPPGWARRHRNSLAWLLPLLAGTAVVQGVNLSGAPQRFDDEGTYVAQAFAVTNFGELAHYTYFYDHPPLGWLQMAVWSQLTGAFARHDTAVTAGREFMLVCTVASAALLWALARRLGGSRFAAGASVLIFALSPLAVQFHRSVYLDNIATPWLLLAFVLALPRREQLASYAGAAAAFGIAVLTKETYLLFLPFLVWQVWRTADTGTRRYALPVAGSVLTLVGSAYLLMAALRSELLPAGDRTSLWDGIWFQLVGRTGSGSLLDTSSAAFETVAIWWRLDPVLVVVGLLAARLALHARPLVPLATAFLFSVLLMLRPGYLPVPYVVPLIALAALLVPASAEATVRRAYRSGRPRLARVATGAVAMGAVLAVGFAGPLWMAQLDGLLTAPQDRPMRQAQAWVVANADRGDRLIVDDAMWVDLVREGFEREDVVWYYKVDTDPDVAALAPEGWSDYDYVVVTESMRRILGSSPVLEATMRNADPVAAFGTGSGRVEVLEVEDPRLPGDEGGDGTTSAPPPAGPVP